MIKDILSHILDDLSKHHRSKKEVFMACVEERLNKSLETYQKELDDTFGFLSRRNELRLLKRMNKRND